MTVSTSANRISYTGDGVTTIFAFPYKFLSTSDLVAYIGTVLKVLITDYTVGTPSANGANVTFNVAPAAAASVVIYRDTDLLQATALPSNGPFPSVAVETMSDKVTLQTQRLSDRIGRTIRQPDSDSASMAALPSASARASMFAAYDASGNPIAVAGAGGGVPAATLVSVIDTIAALKALAVPSSALTYLVRGYAVLGDQGGGIYFWNAADNTADNGGTIIQPNAGGVGRWNKL